MFSLFSLAALLALYNARITSAFEEIDIAYTVAANTNTNVQIVNDLSRSSNSSDGQYSSYRVYLSLTPTGWSAGPACYLVNSSAIAVTNFTIQIPASVGPSDSSGYSYSLMTMEYNNDPLLSGPSSFQYSNSFAFTGGVGQWSQYELSGHIVGDWDLIPCTAYDCARQCSQKYYPANIDSTDAYRQTYNCIAACPGVNVPSFNSINGTGSTGISTSTTLAASPGFAQNTSVLTAAPTKPSPSGNPTGYTNSTLTATRNSTSSTTGSLIAPSTASTTTSSTTPSATNPASQVTISQFTVLAALLGLFVTLIKI